MENTEKINFKNYICLIALSLVIGVLGGTIGILFLKTVSFVTELRNNNSWLIWLLALGGLLITAVYSCLKINEKSTETVIECINKQEQVPPALSVGVFFGTAVSHMLGASVGREGAALQIGGSVASGVGNLFKVKKCIKTPLIFCGMAALFSALFGTPLAALVFVFEIVNFNLIFSTLIIPVSVSSFTAFFVAEFFGAVPERFVVNFSGYSAEIILKSLIVAVLGTVVSVLFCYCLHFSKAVFKKYLKNAYVRSFIGGIIIILLTVFVKTTDYNGGGINIINNIFSKGFVKNEAFLLKILFTSVSIAAGFKGGEIVPTLFVGATLGAAVSKLIGLNVSLGAAVGITALFGGATNCSVTAVLLALELFSGNGFVCCALGAAISFLISGKVSLYKKPEKICFN